MLDDIVDYLTSPAVYVSIYLIIAIQFSMLLSVLTGFPLNYFAMLLPWTPGIYAIIKEERRKSRLGFGVREVTEEQSREALDMIVRELKKTRRL